MQDKTEDTIIYKVVINHEEQYSIWPSDRENALGWQDAGKSGTKSECLNTSKMYGLTCGHSAYAMKWKKWVKIKLLSFLQFLNNLGASFESY